MSWARCDDRYDDTRKIKRAWRMSGYAVGLHWMAITASARHEADGLVDSEWLEERLSMIPKAAAVRALDLLVSEGLFEPLPAGETRTLTDRKGFTITIGPLSEDAHVVHDFFDYNDSSAYLADKRAKDAVRKEEARKRAAGRKDSARSLMGVPADSARTDAGIRGESEPPDPTRPDPTRPFPPSPPRGNRTRDKEEWKKAATSYARSVGVDGDDEALCRAVQQATTFAKVKTAEEFRAFAGQHFESLTLTEVAA